MVGRRVCLEGLMEGHMHTPSAPSRWRRSLEKKRWRVRRPASPSEGYIITIAKRVVARRGKVAKVLAMGRESAALHSQTNPYSVKPAPLAWAK